MMTVDDIGMCVPAAPSDAFGTRDMGVVVGKCVVDMLDLVGVGRRPESKRKQDREPRNQAERPEGPLQADIRTKPAGDGIGEQPAGVRERELSGKQRWAVFRLG